jgi:hypothetical protein
MPTTPNEWLGLALAVTFLLLLAAGLAALGWRGLRALRSAAREGRVDDADGAWKAASLGSEPKRSPVDRHPVLWWAARVVALLVVAPVAIILRTMGTTDEKDGGEASIPDTGANGLFGEYPLGALSITRTHPGPGTHYNARIGKCDDGTDPVGWYDED